MKRFPRFTVALFMAAVYMLIVIRPLAPLAMQSGVVAHAITGECAGDCTVCGCSPERSASHTCCCWKKKLREKRKQERRHVSCCCGKEKPAAPELTCGCPCGDNGPPGFGGTENNEQVPFHFSSNPVFSRDNDISHGYRTCLKDRPGDPPDPPPKLSIPV